MPSDAHRGDDDLSFDEFDDFYKSEQGRAGAGRQPGRPERPSGEEAFGEAGPLDDFGAAGPLPDDGFQDDEFRDSGFQDPAASADGFRADEFRDDFVEAAHAGPEARGLPQGRRGFGVDDPEGGEDLFATLDNVMDEQMVGDGSDDLDDDEFDSEFEEEEGGRNLWPIVVGLITLCVFAGLIYYAYSEDMLNQLMAGDDEPTAEQEVPVVRAPEGPVRERPEDPGGLVVPGQESEVLNPGARQTETILSSETPERPVDLGSMTDPADAGGGGSGSMADGGAMSGGTMTRDGPESEPTSIPPLFGEGPTGDLQPTSPVETLPPVTGAREVEPAPAPRIPSPTGVTGNTGRASDGESGGRRSLLADDPAPSRQQAAAPAPSPTASSPNAPSPTAPPAPEASARDPEPAPSMAAAPASRPAQPAPSPSSASRSSSGGGPYRVQVASMSSEGAAQREWQRLQDQVGDLLGNLTMQVERAVIEGRGTFYRVQAGNLQRGEATSLCNALKGRGVGCLVTR